MKTLTKSAIEKLNPGDERMFCDIQDLSLIRPCNYRNLDEAFLAQLRESIIEDGIQNAVLLSVSKGEVVCIDGHHRIEVVRRLRDEATESGKTWLYRPIPCSVRSTDKPITFDSAAVINNVRRQDTPFERARVIKRWKEKGLSNTKIAQKMGIDRRSVERAALVSYIPESVQQWAEEAKAKDMALYALGRRCEAVTRKRRALEEVFPGIGGSLEERARRVLEGTLKH